MNKKKLRVCVRKEGIPLMALVVYQTFLRRSPFHLRVKRFGCKFQSSSLMMRDVGSIKSSRRAPLRLSLELAFDPSSGLYSIKPKSLRYFSCLNSLSPGLCLVNNKLGLNNKLGKSGSLPGQDSEKGRSKRGLVCPRKILQGHNDCKKNRLQKRTSEYKHKTDKEEEARVNLDVCESVRLDRFLLSPEILRKWPDIVHCLLPKCISDHNPIKLSMMVKGWGSRPFKWFNYLADDKDYVKELSNLCCSEKGVSIWNILRKCKSATKDWVSHKLGDVGSSIRKLESRCTKVEDVVARGVHDNSMMVELKLCRSQLWDNLRRE
ncbi:hypothetical protein V6N13_081077 [Hibiscus sabdariffa]